MAEIFISYIHEEEAVAKAVQEFVHALLNDRNAVYMSSDRWKIFAGEDWLDRIISELRSSKVVVSLFSPESVTRPWVNFEAGAAYIRENTILIPACFGGMTKGSLPKPYSGLQAVDLEDHEDQYYLITSICHYLDRMPPPPVPSLLVRHRMSGDLANTPMEPYRALRAALEIHKEDEARKQKGLPPL